MSVKNKRKDERLKRRFMDAIKEDIKVAEVNEENTIDGKNEMICCGNP